MIQHGFSGYWNFLAGALYKKENVMYYYTVILTSYSHQIKYNHIKYDCLSKPLEVENN